jgi:hypothetical protein
MNRLHNALEPLIIASVDDFKYWKTAVHLTSHITTNSFYSIPRKGTQHSMSLTRTFELYWKIHHPKRVRHSPSNEFEKVTRPKRLRDFTISQLIWNGSGFYQSGKAFLGISLNMRDWEKDFAVRRRELSWHTPTRLKGCEMIETRLISIGISPGGFECKLGRRNFLRSEFDRNMLLWHSFGRIMRNFQEWWCLKSLQILYTRVTKKNCLLFRWIITISKYVSDERCRCWDPCCIGL